MAVNGSDILISNPYVSNIDGWLYSNIYRSSDSGRTFMKDTIIGVQGTIGIINPVLVDDSYYYVGTQPAYEGGNRTGVYVSTNRGVSWNMQNKGLSDSAVSCFEHIIDQNIHYVFAGTQMGVFVSSNNGIDWMPTATTPKKVTILGTKVTLQGATLLLAVTDSLGIFISSDRGSTWSAASNGLKNLRVSKIIANDEYIFCIVQDSLIKGGGVYCSGDNGATWHPMNSGLPEDIVSDIAIGEKLIYIYYRYWEYENSLLGWIRSPAPGLWSMPLSSIVLDVPEIKINNIPVEFSLSQNYPNPFNPSTTITYNIPERSNVRLSIFNTLGQKISDIVDETKNAGSYEHSFNASQLSSGIYFYRIEATSTQNHGRTFVETKKMVLMR